MSLDNFFVLYLFGFIAASLLEMITTSLLNLGNDIIKSIQSYFQRNHPTLTFTFVPRMQYNELLGVSVSLKACMDEIFSFIENKKNNVLKFDQQIQAILLTDYDSNTNQYAPKNYWIPNQKESFQIDA